MSKMYRCRVNAAGFDAGGGEKKSNPNYGLAIVQEYLSPTLQDQLFIYYIHISALWQQRCACSLRSNDLCILCSINVSKKKLLF